MTDVIDPEVLKTLEALTGDSFLPILQSYIKLVNDTRPVIQMAIEDKDGEALEQQTHSLKSSSRQIGAMGIGDFTEALEQAGQSGAFAQAAQIFPAFSQMCDQVISDLNERVKA